MKSKSSSKTYKSVWVSGDFHRDLKALCGLLGVSMEELISPVVRTHYKDMLKRMKLHPKNHESIR